MKKYLLLILLLATQLSGFCQNPIIPNKGVNDPHIRIIDGKAYLSATHDKSIENDEFVMEDSKRFWSLSLTETSLKRDVL